MKAIALFFVLAAATAAGVERPTLNVIPVSPDKVYVTLLNEKPARVEISVTASDGQLVYFKHLRGERQEYRKVFDLTPLENGQYSLAVRVNATTISRKLTVQKNQITVSAPLANLEPMFILNGRLLKLSYLNFEQENLSFGLYQEDEQIHNMSLGSNFVQNRGFDLVRLPAGHYLAILNANGEEFQYGFDLK